MNDFLILLLASIFEVLWVIFLKYSNGFTNLLYSLLTIVTSIISFVLLSLVIKNMQLGIAYSIWTGIGIIGTSILGVLLFGDEISLMEVIYIILIFVGVIGLSISKVAG